MKRLKIEKNKFQWFNALAGIVIVITLFVSFKYLDGIPFYIPLLFWSIIITSIISRLRNIDIFKYDSDGIIRYKIGKKRNKNIWFNELQNITFQDHSFSFTQHIKKVIKQNKLVQHKFDIGEFNKEDIANLKQVFKTYCEPDQFGFLENDVQKHLIHE